MKKWEYDDGERALAAAKANVADTRRAIDDADRLLKEAEAAVRLAR